MPRPAGTARQSLFELLRHAAVSLALATQASAEVRFPKLPDDRPAKTEATAPQTQALQGVPSGFRALSAKEGRAMVHNLAWTDDEEGLAPDCSHLVHTLYERAGHPYPYASSTDLYRGAAHFLRVRAPRPGDLIVWPGHVGIVVSPTKHSFFSSVSTGAQMRDYTSPYWRSRGRARFYRYLTTTAKKVGKAGVADAKQQTEQ